MAGHDAGDGVKFGRRSMLAAVGGAIVSGAPQLDGNSLELFFPDPDQRTRIIIRRGGLKKDHIWTSTMFGDDAVLHISRKSSVHRDNQAGKELRAWWPSDWQLLVERASFPRGREHRLVVRFGRAVGKDNNTFGPWQVAAELTGWVAPYTSPIKLNPVDLDKFLDDPPSTELRMSGRLSASAAQACLAELFADNPTTRGPVSLGLDRTLTWHIGCDEDLLLFDGRVRAAGLTVRRVADAAPSRPTGARPGPAGLHATVAGPIRLASANTALYLGSATSQDESASARLEVPPSDLVSAELKHAGVPAATVTTLRLQDARDDANLKCRAVLILTLAAKGRPPTQHRFEAAALRLERSHLLGKPAETQASLTPTAKEQTVATPFGPMDVRSAPPMPRRPGEVAAVPSICVRANSTGRDQHVLTGFDAVLSLSAMGIRLPEYLPPPQMERHVTRLDFDSAECRFTLPILGGSESPTSADALVPLTARGGPGALRALIGLNSARLTVLRPDDLLSLGFRFSGLLLDLPRLDAGQPGRVLPSRGAPVCRGMGAGRPTLDERPILVVEFPPQHVAEQAFLRRDPALSPPPELYLGPNPTGAQLDELALLRRPKEKGAAARKRRIEARKSLRGETPAFAAEEAARVGAKAVVDEFERRAAVKDDHRRPKLPREQRLYISAEFLDADGRKLLREVMSARAGAAGASDIPSLKLPTLAEVLVPFGLTPATFDPSDPKQVEASDAVERAKDALSGEYAWFRRSFQKRFHVTWRGQAWLSKAQLGTAAQTFVETYGQADEPIAEFAQARLSGKSRLAFRINCDDFQAERLGGGFDFTLDALTNWGSMDLAVVRRAERLVRLTGLRGPLPPRWARIFEVDEGKILHFQNIGAGDHLAADADKHARTGGVLPKSSLMPSQVTPTERLADVAKSARSRPDPFETAIELPFRLFLSPAQDANWLVPNNAIRRGLFPKAGPAEAHLLWSATLGGRGVEAGLRAVWSPDFRPTALMSATDRPGAPPRGPYAPWSLPRSYGSRTAPPGDEVPLFRTALDSYDRHELVALTSLHGLPILGRRDSKGALLPGSQFDPPDGFHLDGLVKDIGPSEGGGPRDHSAIYRPQPLDVAELALTALGGNLDHDTTFTPPASALRDRSDLNLPPSNLFDAFAIERWRQRTVLGRDIAVEVVYKGFLFPLGHRAALVKVTERRFEQLHKTGEPVAVLIQHQFLQIGQPEKTFPAYQQPNRGCRWAAERVTLLTRRTPDLADPDTDGGGKMEFGTGHVFWPRIASRPGAEVKFEVRIDDEAVSGALPLVFVDNTAAHDPVTIKALVDWYNDGTETDERYIKPDMRKLPRHGQSVRMAPPRKEGDTSLVTDWWDLRAEGRLSGKEPGKNPAAEFLVDNRNYVMDTFMEGLDQPGFYPFVNGARCRLAQVERFTGKDTVWGELTYDGFYVANGFIKPKDDQTMAIANEVFLRLTGPEAIKMQMSGADRAGGVASPNLDVVGLSRAVGPIGRATYKAVKAPEVVHDGPTALASISDFTNLPKAPMAAPATAPLSGSPPPTLTTVAKQLFPEDAKLLGLIKLQDVVKVTTALASQPKLREVVEYGVGAAGVSGSAVRAYVTANVLTPIDGMLKELEALWARVAAQAYAGVSLADAYPQIGAALTALGKSVGDALDPSKDDVAFLESLAVIYEAGRNFIAVIETVSRDPLASISDAQLSQLNALVNQMRALVAAVAALPAAMSSLATVLQAKVADWVIDSALDGWRRLLFALPLPDPALSQPVRDAFDQASAAALREGLGTTLRALPRDWNLGTLPGNVAARLRASAGSGPLRTVLDQAADELEARAANRAALILTPYAVTTLARLRKAYEAGTKLAADLSGDATALAATVLDAAASVLGAVAEIFADAAFAAAAGEQIVCSMLVEQAAPALVSFAHAVLASAGTTAAGCDSAAAAFKLMAGSTVVTAPPAAPAPVAQPTLNDGLTTLLYATRCLVYLAGQAAGAPTDKLAILSNVRTGLAQAGERLALAAGQAVRALDGLSAPAMPTPPAICTGLPAGFINKLSALLAAQKEFASALAGLAAIFAAPPTGTSAQPTPAQAFAAVVAWAANRDDTDWDALLPALHSGAEALRGAGQVAIAFLQTGSLLGSATDQLRKGQLTDAADRLDAAANTLGTGAGPDRLHAVAGLLRGAPAALATLQTQAQTLAAKLAALPLAVSDRAGVQAVLVDLDGALVGMSTLADTAQAQVRSAIEDQAVAVVTSLQLAQEEIGAPLLQAGMPIVTPLINGLATLYRLVTKGRDELKARVTGAGGSGGKVLDILLQALRSRLGEALFEVPLDPGTKDDAAKLCGATCDRLAYEDALAQAALSALNARRPAEAAPIMAKLAGLWSPAPAILTLLRQFAAIDADFARTLILSAIDLKAVRREVDARIRELIPARVTLPYDLDTELNSVPEGKNAIFVPEDGTKLQLHAQTIVHLLPGEDGHVQPPTFAVTGQIGPFAVNLLGAAFDVVKLHFHGLSFSAGSGASPDFQVRFKSVEMGEQASFLKPLQDYLSPKAGGFYITALEDRPGIEAGYGINLGVIGVGALSFSNVILNAAVRLPFGGGKTDEARFVISIGRQDAPFLISSTIFGGGGYLALIANSQRFVGFEASFDYGGVAAFGFGPLQGIGRLTMGIYLRKEDEATTLGATFFAGGAAHIACFGMSTSLCVRLLHNPGGAMKGSAEYTFSFSLGIDDIDFHVSVVRDEGSSVGTNAQAALLDPAFEERTRYAKATNVMSDSVGRPSQPDLKVVGTSQARDWQAYRKYFDLSLVPARKPRKPA